MNPTKLITALIGMLVMGVLAFWGMAALWSYRTAQPIERGQSGLAATDTVRALQQGVQQDLQLAKSALQNGNQTDLARALDGARRVARVGNFAADPLFATPLGAIESARNAIQNHQHTVAVKAVQEALGAIAAESPTGRGELTVKPDQYTRQQYEGAVVINACGDRIGRVKTMTGGKAVLVLGGKQDIFGFINVGGTEVTVPVHDLVLGQAHRLGPKMVALLP
ncbi:MAG TPA: hypothetical protein VHD62_08775 [Opitutaceae bacterium]|nr:hypothetical protein [Opitutaceae bacterium]